MFEKKRNFAGLMLLAACFFVPIATPVAADRSADHASGASAQIKATGYRSAEAERVSDIKKPFGSVAYGTVVLDVLLSETGEIINVQVRRDIAGLTQAAIGSVQSWKFRPALMEGKAVRSRITVAVTFNPDKVTDPDVELSPLRHQSDEARIQSAFQPPEVTRAAFPMNATDSDLAAMVVVQAVVNTYGKAERATVLRDFPPFTYQAVQAVRDWAFMPATLNGAPLSAKVILVFVFSQPAVARP